jgi:hypothetical protein
MKKAPIYDRGFLFLCINFISLANTNKASPHFIKIKEVKISLPSVCVFHHCILTEQIYVNKSKKQIFLITIMLFY